jgi:predicted transcriptional regulator
MTDRRGGEQPQVEVTLTIADDWRSDPLRVIAGIREGSRSLDEWQRKAVAAAREQGRTWDEIGAACGVSRQAAWERFSTD